MIGTETCDDGTNNTEGCSNDCKGKQTPDWICVGGSPSSATKCKLCGNGKREFDEACDDAVNDTDGCL